MWSNRLVRCVISRCVQCSSHLLSCVQTQARQVSVELSKGDIENGDTLLSKQTVSWIDFEEPCYVSVHLFSFMSSIFTRLSSLMHLIIRCETFSYISHSVILKLFIYMFYSIYSYLNYSFQQFRDF